MVVDLYSYGCMVVIPNVVDEQKGKLRTMRYERNTVSLHAYFSLIKSEITHYEWPDTLNTTLCGFGFCERYCTLMV